MSAGRGTSPRAGGGAVRGLQAVDARVKLLCLVAYLVAALHARSAAALGVCLAVAVAFALAARVPGRAAAGVLRPFAAILVVTAVMQVLCIQEGAVLVQLGPVGITSGALLAAARMLAALFAVMLAAVAFMRCTPVDALVRAVGQLLQPLRAVGVRTEAAAATLALAFAFVPVLVGEWGQLVRAQTARGASFAGGVRVRLGAYMRLFAPLARGALRHADTVAEAMVSRCFCCGIAPTQLHRGTFGVPEAACMAASVLACALAFAL